MSDSENGLPSRYQRPWLVRMVVVTLAIMGDTAYVYGGRFSVRLMRGGRRREGVGVLAYVKVIILIHNAPRERLRLLPQNPATALSPRPVDHRDPLPPPARGHPRLHLPHGHRGGPYRRPYEELRPATTPATHVPGTALPLPLTNGHPPPANGHAPLTNGQLKTAPPPPPRRKFSARSRSRSENDASAPPRGRFPPTTAALLRPHRWHCRVCGTCVLKFDHHYPWIEQCVGARNHKFFLNFVLATALFTLYTFASLLAFNVRGGRVGPQEGVVIGIAALFALFTLSLGAAHTRMVLLSQTTVESLGAQRIKEREGAALAAAGVRCADFGTKCAARVAYDAEWGAPDTEGNLWWVGGPRAGEEHRHNLLEHDAPIFRNDFGIGDNLYFNETVFTTLASANPDVNYYNATSAEFIFRTIESALYLNVMGDPLTGVAPKNFVQILFREERLPIA
ncbi:DHHC palmitoyltransferase-domain-containing protein [Mycena rosella]|uniref:Palmitoyltransferase n=1 Tax=Mycena rosella TaxID=1033263 RepID=A0AAD7M6V2_MYCRO|nr:DHHC palmitoyltransferase-domain-containing protein [Mycena rosella]